MAGVGGRIALLLIVGVVVTGSRFVPVVSGVPAPVTAEVLPGGGTGGRFACSFNANGYITGAYGTASAMGWAGNSQGVVACLGGSFFVQDGVNRSYGFGIYTGTATRWTNAGGYLPALITTFGHDEAAVSITEFADRVFVGGHDFVLLYSRVAVGNPTDHAVMAAPQPTAGLVPLATAPDVVGPHGRAVHDYVIAVDRFGHIYPWPSASALIWAGSFVRHYAHMQAFWNAQLAQIAQIDVPDKALADAYRSGFIFTQIARSGDHLNTGVNGYQSEFSHDVIGIMANLFTQGYFDGAPGLLEEARSVVGSQGQYPDGLWTYPWPWAIYLLKSGDLASVRANFSTEGPAGASQPSIVDAARAIAAGRTGPGGIMGATNDIDTDGYWTIDDYEALMGLAAYRYLAGRVGDETEVRWAAREYDSLLAATNRTLTSTIARYHLRYLPCSIVQPNTANRCQNPEDANWGAPFLFGRWAWDGQNFGAAVSGPGISLIDGTYAYGFARLKGSLPPDTFGGYPDDYYSTAYNAGYGSWGLAGQSYRDQGILSYDFMIDRTQSGPFSWWESVTAPSAGTPWIGSHPAAGQGSSPHAWGMANANKVLLDSLVAQRSDGTLLIGRGVPAAWLGKDGSITVANFPTVDGKRLDLRITWDGRAVKLTLTGSRRTGDVIFQLPAFIGNIASSSAGHFNEQTGTVWLSPSTRSVRVRLCHSPSS